jgi:hypothetical protein
LQLVIWGERDRYLGPKLAEPDRDDVPNLDRVERLPDASHWVHYDGPEYVTQQLTSNSQAQATEQLFAASASMLKGLFNLLHGKQNLGRR